MPTARSTLARFARIRPAQLSRARRDTPRVVLADLDGGGGRGGLLGSSGADMLTPAGPVAVQPVQGFTGAPTGGLLAAQPAMSQGALQSGLALAQQAMGLKNAVQGVGGLLGSGSTLSSVGAGASGLGGASTAAAGVPFSMAPSVAGSSVAPSIAGTTASTVAPGAGLGGSPAAFAPAAAGGLAAAAPLLAFGGPAAAFAVASKFNDAQRARGSFKVNSAGEITHRNLKDASIASKAAFNDFADWVGRNIAESGAKVPDPGDVSFGVRGGKVFLRPAGGGEPTFFNDPRELLSALTAMAGKRRDFSNVDVPDFSEAGRQAATAEAERLTGVVGGRTGLPGGPIAGDIFAPTGMIGRLEDIGQNARGLIDQPQFLGPGGGLL